jgi:predicted aspartyl protease
MTRLLVLLVGLVLAAGASAQDAKAGKCKLLRIAQWMMRAEYYSPVVDAMINGQYVRVLLDTAAPLTVVRRAATRSLNLVRTEIEGHPNAEAVYINEFRIGKWERNDWRVLVAGEHDFGDDVALVLGDDFFQNADIEFDFQSNAVRVYQTKDCEDAALAYWARAATQVPLAPGGRVQLEIAINGKPVRAVLDSGASRSLLGAAEAEKLGVTPQSAGTTPAGCVGGYGKNAVDSWTAQFESFAIGDEVIRNPRIRFADLERHTGTAPAGMLLGADFLHSHRVLVSRSQGKLYFTYAGGTVFPRPPAGRACTTPSQ